MESTINILVKSDYHGKGVSKAIANVNNIIAKELVGKDWDLANQSSMDDLLINLDGTANKVSFFPTHFNCIFLCTV